MSLRQRLHDWSLLAFALIAVYLAWAVLAGRLALGLGRVLGAGTSTFGRVTSGFLLLDLSKLPLLIAAGWLLCRLTRLGTWSLTLSLVLGSYALEIGLGLLLGQAPFVLAGSAVLLLRLAGALCVGALLLFTLRRFSRALRN